MKNTLSKKECHVFLTCGYEIPIHQALVYAVAKVAGASDGNALRIAKSKLSEPHNFKKEYWRQVIRYFAINEVKEFHIINDLFDYISSMVRENPNFTIIGYGYTVSSLLKRMENWHRHLARMKIIGEGSWDGISIPDSEYILTKEKIESKWSITQIKTGKALAEEGNKMRHCVVSYKHHCVNNVISIWSVKCENSRKLTIELSNSDKRIKQIRGLANRMPYPYEMTIVKKWAQDNNLKLNLYLT